ncbi:MAG: hypothetical protein WCD53_14280 [Microcoleus sp.]
MTLYFFPIVQAQVVVLCVKIQGDRIFTHSTDKSKNGDRTRGSLLYCIRNWQTAIGIKS